MKNQNENIKSNMATGASTTIGATAGVIIGNLVSQPASASEMGLETDDIPVVDVDESTEQEDDAIIAEEADSTDYTAEVSSTTGHESNVPESQPTPVTENVRVTSYETITNEDGSQSDIAILSMGEGSVPVGIVDVDRDGIADIAISDINQNGQLDEGEVVDLTGQNLAMSPLHDAAMMSSANMAQGNLAQLNADSDYTNDANVDEYMA